MRNLIMSLIIHSTPRNIQIRGWFHTRIESSREPTQDLFDNVSERDVANLGAHRYRRTRRENLSGGSALWKHHAIRFSKVGPSVPLRKAVHTQTKCGMHFAHIIIRLYSKGIQRAYVDNLKASRVVETASYRELYPTARFPLQGRPIIEE